MLYVLITPNGRQFIYHVLAAAEIYKAIHGGAIHVIENDIRIVN
jgi:hypothetical protein